MKKICIATWYGPTNYGTALQAVALSHYLTIYGYEVCYVEDKRKIEGPKKNKGFMYKVNELFTGRWFARRKYHNDLIEKNRLQSRFINKYASVFIIYSDADIIKLNKSIDIFIAGGDQIWNPFVYENVFLLSVADKDKLKISYGTSVGVKSIPEELKNKYKKYLLRFNKISVREEQSAKALIEIVGKEIDVVVDPTLLLSSDEWSFLLEEAEIEKRNFQTPYILCYFVGTRKTYWKYVKKIQKKTGYKVIVIPINNEAYMNPYEKYVKVSPAEFLWLIKNATIICTDSFHATIFSIQYNKEFYVLKRFLDTDEDSQNGRLVDLLTDLCLENRIIHNESTFVRSKEIDFAFVQMQLQIERRISAEWLKNALREK